jgi:hypothetical protein
VPLRRRRPIRQLLRSIWTQGWRTGDLVRIGTEHDNPEHLTQAGDDEGGPRS